MRGHVEPHNSHDELLVELLSDNEGEVSPLDCEQDERDLHEGERVAQTRVPQELPAQVLHVQEALKQAVTRQQLLPIGQVDVVRDVREKLQLLKHHLLDLAQQQRIREYLINRPLKAIHHPHAPLQNLEDLVIVKHYEL